MNEALRLGPNGSLRPHVYCTLIGLLASSGLRVGEALQLNMEDVRLDVTTPHLHIVEGKFRKSRLVPLHATTAEKLTAYAKERKRLCCDAMSDAFFVSEKGGHINYDACWDTLAGSSVTLEFEKECRLPPGLGFTRFGTVSPSAGWWSGTGPGYRSRS